MSRHSGHTAPNCPRKRERIEILADLMVGGKYKTRETARALAQRWGIGHRTIENDACEAARMLAVPPDQREARRASVAAYFERLAHEAHLNVNKRTGLPDYGASIRAMELYARYAGLDLENSSQPAATSDLAAAAERVRARWREAQAKVGEAEVAIAAADVGNAEASDDDDDE